VINLPGGWAVLSVLTYDDHFIGGPTVFAEDLVLRLAALAYLGRFTGTSRMHTESDLRLFLAWCADQQLRPLEVQRAQVERYVRWMQETRRFKPSTVSRRMAVVAGFYRTGVIDAILEHSPADYVRRPPVPAESPTLGLSHLQFEALLTAARDSINVFDFALVAMLGLRIFKARGTDVTDIGEEHGHRVLRVLGKGTKHVLVPLPPAVGRALARSTTGRAARSCSTDVVCGWIGTVPPVVCGRWRGCRWCGCRGCTRTCCATPTSPPCSTPASTCAMSK
jgi:integrase